MSSRYEIAPLFAVRMTGFPVEWMASLRSPALLREVDEALPELERAAAAEKALLARVPEGSGGEAWAFRRRILEEKPLTGPLAERHAAEVEALRVARTKVATARERIAATYQTALAETRQRLREMAATPRFREMLLLSSPSLEALTPDPHGPLPSRNSDMRRRENTWMAYVQRLTTKNETISFFGPTLWGKVEPAAALPVEIELVGATALAGRTVYAERWAVTALAAKMLEDPELGPVLPIECADDLLLAGGAAELLGSGKKITLSSEERAALTQLGEQSRPPSEVGPPELVARLRAEGALITSALVTISPAPLDGLRRAVASWPEGPRRRWLAHLDDIEASRRAVETQTELEPRRAALARLTASVERCGVPAIQSSQALNACRLSVNEDCQRAAKKARIGGPLIEQLTSDLVPFYEWWRDLAGVYARGLLDALVPVWKKLATDGPVRLPSFLLAADTAGIPLRVQGGAGYPRELDARIQQAFQEEMGDRLREPEITLSEHDLGFLRRRFPIRRLRTHDAPAPDIQIIAHDEEALAAGRWTLLLGELHPEYSFWEHCFLTWCPDPQALAAFQSRAPGFMCAVMNAWSGGGAHTYVHVPRYVPGWTFTRSGHVEGARSVRSATVTVHLEEDDLVARDAAGALLGSLIDTWNVVINTHRFELTGTGSHVPRMKVGRAIVRRRSWLVEPTPELREKIIEPGIDQSIELRRLQRHYGLPDEIFVRPLLPIRGTFHKDAKPMFVDFRSPLLLELFSAQLRRYAKAWVSEMRPATEECWLADESGHFSCELRLGVTPPGYLG